MVAIETAPMMELEAAGLSDAGPSRPTNEDSIGSFTPADPAVRRRKGCLFALADGVGGHNAGEVASATAVATILEEYFAPSSHSRVEPALRQAIQTANLRVHDLSQRSRELRSMQTTLTALALAGTQAYIAHVGDSRAYLWRDGALSQLTTDHSEVAELVRMRLVKPERLRDHPGRNVLTRTIGSQLILRPDFQRRPVKPGDRLVLCSDGLWSEIDEAEMAEILASCEPTEACRVLIDRAIARECLDNVSVQVVKVVAVEVDQGQHASRNRWLPGFFRRSGAI